MSIESNFSEDPKQIYQKKLAQSQLAQRKLKLTSGRLASVRLLLFLTACLVAWLALGEDYLSVVWLLIPFGAFLIAVKFHSRVAFQQRRAQQVEELYAQRLEYFAGRWVGQGNSGSRYCDIDHPYSSDLDIFGSGSLFESICSVRTRMGEDMLAAWLNFGADLNTIERRQHAVEELRNEVDFREEMVLLDVISGNELNKEELLRWVKQSSPITVYQRVLAALLGVSTVVWITAWANGYGGFPLLIVITLAIALYAGGYRKIKRITAESERTISTLAGLVQVLGLIEQKQFKTPLLRQLNENLQSDGHPPSWQINKLRNLISQLNQCTLNQVLMPFAFLLGMPIHVSHQLEQWRKQIGPDISKWLDTVGQIEALNSLAQYRFEHPDNTFPELIPESAGPSFNAVDLCHPLIPFREQVSNDIRIDSSQRLIMVSGSNMSGKSTLLRAIGVNLVLAYCGAPVQARKLNTSCFIIGSAMRANDSLKQGASLFYKVISRIKCVVELAGKSPPLLFLLDEILQGTNSHDRLIGAKGIIHQLLERNAVGLVTTHDLALTEIVSSLDGQAINIHFQDHIENDIISFDYKIRSGVIQKSNGLELMRMVGLDVDFASADECIS